MMMVMMMILVVMMTAMAISMLIDSLQVHAAALLPFCLGTQTGHQPEFGLSICLNRAEFHCCETCTALCVFGSHNPMHA